MCRFNKEEEDFSSKRDFDDYLEEREDIIFNLVEGIQVNEMENKVAKYQKENAESIARNEARKLQRVLVDNTQHADMTEEDDVDLPEHGMFPGIHDDAMVHLPRVDDRNTKKQTKEEWDRMALSSGWDPGMQRAKCIHVFQSSLHIVAAG